MGRLRLSQSCRRKLAQRLFLVSNVRYDENDAFGNRTTYRLAPAFIVPVTESKLKASLGTGFKTPTLSQLYVDFRPAFNFFGNPNLLPEQSVGYDFGFEQPLANDRFRFGVTRYHNNITNLINTNATGTSYINVGEAITSGYEAFASAAVTDRLRLRTDYTYTKAIDAITELELLRRPRHKYTLAAEWNPTDQLLLSATWLRVSTWIDGNRDFSIQRLTAPGYAVLNLAANYTVNHTRPCSVASTTCSTSVIRTRPASTARVLVSSEGSGLPIDSGARRSRIAA